MSETYKNNTTGCRGVCYETRANRYRAYISVCGEKIRLGSFVSLDDAVKARKDDEIFYKTNYEGDFRIIRLINQNKEKCFYALLKSVFTYDGTLSFPTHAIIYIRKFLSENNSYDSTWMQQFESLQFDNKDMFIDWLNGDSYNKISKKYNIPSTSIYRIIKNCINFLKNNVK